MHSGVLIKVVARYLENVREGLAFLYESESILESGNTQVDFRRLSRR